MHRNVALLGVRFNWVDVLTGNRFSEGDDLRFRAEVIIEPDSPAAKALDTAITEAAEEKWPGKSEGMIKVATSGGKCCKKVGNEMPIDKKTFEVPEYYLGNTVLSTSRVFERDGAPRVFVKRISSGKLVEITKDTPLDEDLVKPQRGAHGDVMVSLWGWEFGGAPQINCTLDAIAFTNPGDPISQRAPIEDEEVAVGFGKELEVGETPFG